MDLPRVILVEILLRLPIKAIFCCKCVCKFWYELSSDPSFLKIYPPFPCLLVSGVDKYKRYVSSIVELKADYDYNSCPLNRPTLLNPNLPLSKLTLIGSCNGFLCLFHDDSYIEKHSVYICNPLLGEYFKVKLRRKGARVIHVSYGFCYSEVSGQYKVLRLVQRSYFDRRDIVNTLEVYTLGVDKNWRTWGKAPFPVASTFGNVNVNGAVHWMTNDYPECYDEYPEDYDGYSEDSDDDLEDRVSVFSFDVETERLHYLPVPSGLPNDSFRLMLGELRNCLCLTNSVSEQQVDIWWMKEYGNAESWTKDYILMGCIPPDINCANFLPTITWKDGEILMQTFCGTQLVSYSPKEDKLRKVNVYSSESPTIYVDKYFPNFNSLKTIMGDSFQVKNVYPKTKVVL